MRQGRIGGGGRGVTRGGEGSDEVEGAPGIWASPGTNYTGADV